MFSTRVVNHKNRFHERRLRAFLNEEISAFKAMPSKNNDTTISVKKIQKIDD